MHKTLASSNVVASTHRRKQQSLLQIYANLDQNPKYGILNENETRTHTHIYIYILW